MSGSIIVYYLYKKYKKLATLSHTVSNNTYLRTTPINTSLFPNYVKNSQNLWLYTHSWTISKPKGLIFLSHGLGEHILRYEHIARYLNAHGYNVVGIDHQGHGQSEGSRVHVIKYQDYIDDYLLFINKMVSEYPELPKFLIGHSNGGLIASHVARYTPTLWNGIILSAPLLKPDPKMADPVTLFLVRNLAKYLPKLGVNFIPSSLLSHELQSVARYDADPLIYHGSIRVNWAFQVLGAMEELKRNSFCIHNPLLILHGTADSICSIDGSRDFIQSVSSFDKQLIEIDSSFHELFLEKGHDVVFDHILKFLEDHCHK